MLKIFNKKIIKFTVIFYIFLLFNVHANNLGSITGYEIPRFISLKSDQVNLRVGSSKNYPIILTYNQKNLPLKIIDEEYGWRKVIDIEGNEGWVYEALIKGDRFAVINIVKNNFVNVYSKPNEKFIGKIGKRNIVKIKSCLNLWCLVEYSDHKGWVLKSYLWGVFKEENINVSIFQKIKKIIWNIDFIKKKY